MNIKIMALLLVTFLSQGNDYVFRINDVYNSIFNAKKRVMEDALKVDVIYENIYVENVHVGGLTKEDARQKLLDELDGALDNIITFSCDGDSWTKRLTDLSVEYNIEEAVELAYAYARTGSLEYRFEIYKKLADEPVNISAPYTCDLNVVKRYVSEIADKYYIAPVEPKISRQNKKFNIINEVVGREINSHDLENKLVSMVLEKQSGVIDITFNSLKPKNTAEQFRKSTNLIGSYSTKLNGIDYNRTSNVLLAASRINNVVVNSGEEFSTNRAFNPEKSGDNGYLPASAYLQGRVVDSIGGGICQVATTLYMALLYSELEITQRQNHSMPVSYVDFAFDATLVDNLIDLKFKNNTDYPVTIESYVSGSEVFVNIYGFENRPTNRYIRFENTLLETIQPPATVVTYDENLLPTQKIIEVKERPGYKYKLYKLVFVDGQLKERILMNTSNYKAVRGEVKAGKP